MAFRRLKPEQHDSQADTLRKSNAILATGLGLYGADRYTGGTTEGEWLIVHAFEDSVITIIRNGVSVPNIDLKAGDRVYGNITSITVTSGDVEAYRSPQ